MLDHEKLIVYQYSIAFVSQAHALLARMPKGHSALADQLRRAALSIPLNIAEGCGKPNDNDRARFYAIARGSAMECAAILDVVAILSASSAGEVAKGKDKLTSIVKMLSKMCR